MVNRSRYPADTPWMTAPGGARRKPPQSPARSWRDNLKLNKVGKKKGVVCMAIQTVAVVRIDCRHG